MSSSSSPRTSRRAIVLFCIAGFAFGAASPALAQEDPSPPAITSPADGAQLSLALDDNDPAATDFQVLVQGTADPNEEVAIHARRPGSASPGEEVATTQADGNGDWSEEVTLDPGEWVLVAVAGDETSEEVRIFIVTRYVFTWYDQVNSAGNWVMVANPGDTQTRADVFVAGQKRTSNPLVIPAGQARTVQFAGVIGGPVVVHGLDGLPVVATQRTVWKTGDFEEVAGVFDGHLSDDAWFTWYDTRNSGGRDWIVVTNFGTQDTAVSVQVGDTSLGGKVVAPGTSATFRQEDLVGGPVHVTASAGQPVHASRRTLWTPDNFTELVATPDRWLHTDVSFSWYDAVNTNGRNWVMVANPNDETVSVDIELPDGSFDFLEVGAGVSATRRYPDLIGGPLFVEADLPVLVTQRALWASGQSFEETPGVFMPEITDTYHHTWYDTASTSSRGDWFVQGSVFPAGDAEGDVAYSVTCPEISDQRTLESGDVEARRYPDRIGGPCTIQGDGPFIQSRRTLWGEKGDFTELNGARGTRLSGEVHRVEAPGNLTLDALPNDDGTNLAVSWDESGDDTVDGYWAYRSSDEVGEPLRRVAFVPASACDGGSCGFVDSHLEYEAEYTYHVHALSLATLEGLAATATGAPVDNPPSAPTWPEDGAVVAGDQEVHLTWNENPEPDIFGYHVWFAEAPEALGEPVDCDDPNLGLDDADYTRHTTEPVESTTYTVTGLENDQRYCFKVQAVDFGDNESELSEPREGTPGQMPPETTLTHPEGGEVLAGGSTLTITYEATDPNDDITEIVVETRETSSSPFSRLDHCTENTGSCDWEMPEIDSQTARVRVTAVDSKDNQDADESDDFAIDSTPPSVTITAPTGGQQFAGGEPITIEWNSTEDNPADDGISTDWRTGGGEWQEIAECTGIEDTGSCEWTDTPGIDSSTVQVRVTLRDDAGFEGNDVSAEFTIVTPPAAPTGLSATGADQEVDLDWSDNTESDLAGYHVYFAEEPSGIGSNGCDDLADGDYTRDTPDPITESQHTVDNLTNDTTYCFQVTAVDTTGGESDRSAVAEATPQALPPDVTVQAPDGEEVLKGGTQYTILWTDDDPDGNKDRVRLEYTTNFDADTPTWVVIDDFAPNNGEYVWNIPGTDSQEVRVRVTATDTKGNTDGDTSDANLAIDSTAPFVQSPISLTGEDPDFEDPPFRGGEQVEVEFDFQERHPDEDFVLEFASDGSTFQATTCSSKQVTMSSDTNGTASCLWTAASVDVPQARLRVTLFDEATNEGQVEGHSHSRVSDPFEIDSTVPGIPVLTTIDGQDVDGADPEPQAFGNDRDPETVVAGPGTGTYQETGTVRIYVASRPANCGVDPAGELEVSGGTDAVIFNEGAATDFQYPDQDGNHSTYVCMIDAAGNRSAVTSVADRIVYQLDRTEPSTPQNVDAESDGPGEVRVTWNRSSDNLSGVAGYDVFFVADPVDPPLPSGCETVSDDSYAKHNEELISDPEYVADLLEAGTRYCFKVRAVDRAGNPSELSSADSAVAGGGS